MWALAAKILIKVLNGKENFNNGLPINYVNKFH